MTTLGVAFEGGKHVFKLTIPYTLYASVLHYAYRPVHAINCEQEKGRV